MISRDSQVIDQIRRFDRFYEKLLRSALQSAANEDFSAADIGVLSELGWATGGGRSGTWLAYRLGLDTGYLCRVLKKLEAWQLIAARLAPNDARMRTWELTASGRRFADGIESEYRDRVFQLVQFDVMPADQARLVEAMRAIEEILATTALRDLFDARPVTPSGPRTRARRAAAPRTRHSTRPRAPRGSAW